MYNIRLPQGGRIRQPPRLRPAPRAPLAWGGTPPGPLAAPPGAPSGTGPCSVIQPEGFRHGCDGGGGGQPLAVVHARRLAPGGFRASGEIQRGPCRGTAGFGGVPPAVGNPAQAVGGQAPAGCCARRPRTGRGCPRRPGYRAHLFGRALEKTGVFLRTPESCISGGAEAKAHFVYLIGN